MTQPIRTRLLSTGELHNVVQVPAFRCSTASLESPLFADPKDAFRWAARELLRDWCDSHPIVSEDGHTFIRFHELLPWLSRVDVQHFVKLLADAGYLEDLEPALRQATFSDTP